MSSIRASNLVRLFGSGTAGGGRTTAICLPNDPQLTTYAPDAYTLYVDPTLVGYTSWGEMVPIQWEVKNDSSTAVLPVAFGSRGVQPAAGSTLANTITLNAGQAYTMQKRQYEQEMTITFSFVDLPRVYLQPTLDCTFSVTVDVWIPGLGS